MNSISKNLNRIFMAALTIEVLGCFLFQSVNSVMARFTSLISFFILAALIAGQLLLDNNSNFTALFKNKRVLFMLFGSCLALLNLFIIGSNKGAFLTAADVLMAFYLAYDHSFTKKQCFYAFCLASSLLIWWYCTVRWYFNFNQTGMIFMLTGIMTMLLLEMIKNAHVEYSYLTYIQATAFFTTTLLCLLYHARCTLAGMLIFAVLYFIIPYIAKNKVLRHLLIAASTIGSLIFTALYILLDALGISITILYKDILSGRQDIWRELWEAFSKQPLTGIGSSYHLKSFFIFEVHNGMLDLLIVHGLPVFICALVLIYSALNKRMLQLASSNSMSRLNQIALTGVFTILFTSFFENFFINSPYLLIVLLLLSLPYDADKA